MKIRTKIVLPIIFTALILLSSASIYSYFFTVNILEEEAVNNLESVAELIKNHIKTSLIEQKEKIEIAATHGELSTEELKVIQNISPEFSEVFVVDANGIIITSTDPSEVGLDRSNDDYFINTKNKTYFKKAYLSEVTGKNSITVSTPHAGGILVVRIDLSFFDSILSNRTGLGETGESLLAYRNDNNEAVFFTQRRFEEQVWEAETLEEKHGVRPVDEALKKNEGVFFDLHDYRHINVVSVTKYIEEVDMGLVVKIDEVEVLSGARNLLIFFVVSLVFVGLIFFIVVYLIARIISKPILALREGIEIIKQGDLDYKVGTEAKDEIGQLSRSFDDMTIAIKESRAEVDKKVLEQTAKIQANLEKIASQQVATLNILEDVEKEKEKVDIEKEKITAILQSIGDGVFVVDKDLNIIICNQVTADISGYSCEELEGHQYDEVLKFIFEKDGKTNDQFIRQAIATGEVKNMSNHTLLIKKDGVTKVPVADSAAPLKNKKGEVVGCVVVFRDVTEERKIDKAKSEFVSVASHQLRTPMTGIKWVIERIVKTEKLSEKGKGYLMDMQSSMHRLSNLVNSLLNISRIDSGRIGIVPRQIEVVKFVFNFLIECRPIVSSKKQIIKFNDAPESLIAETDENALRNIVQSLVSNAIEYTPNGGTIEIGLYKKEHTFVIMVKDNGIGIPQADQAKIFTKFGRASNASEVKTDGSGLGLYIVKSAVLSLGGKIGFDSVIGKGTRFVVELPLKSIGKKGERSFT